MIKIFTQFSLLIKFAFYETLDRVRGGFINKGILEEVEYLGGGLNKKFVVQDRRGKKWVVKFCHHLGGKTADICEREELTFLIGRLIDLPVKYTKVISSDRVRIKTKSSLEDEGLIKDKCVLVEYIDGKSLKNLPSKDRLQIKNKNLANIRKIIIFYHWLGEEDRGLDDVMFDKDYNLYFIDHGLTGPGHSNKELRSNHPFVKEYKEEDITKMCFPGKDSFIEFIINSLGVKFDDLMDFEMIKLIQSIPKFILKKYIYRFNLVDADGNDFREKYLKVIIKRQNELKNSYSEWVGKLKAIMTKEKSE